MVAADQPGVYLPTNKQQMATFKEQPLSHPQALVCLTLQEGNNPTRGQSFHPIYKYLLEKQQMISPGTFPFFLIFYLTEDWKRKQPQR